MSPSSCSSSSVSSPSPALTKSPTTTHDPRHGRQGALVWLLLLLFGCGGCCTMGYDRLVMAEEQALAPCRALLNACATAPDDEADACLDRAEACAEEVGQRFDPAFLALTGSTER